MFEPKLMVWGRRYGTVHPVHGPVIRGRRGSIMANSNKHSEPRGRHKTRFYQARYGKRARR